MISLALLCTRPTPSLPPHPSVLCCSNVIDHPESDKYRRIKLANPAFHSRLGCRTGGKECMAAIGFRWDAHCMELTLHACVRT